MKQKQWIYRPISVFIILTFLWSNLVWAGVMDGYKLSAPSQVTVLAPVADAFSSGQKVVKGLVEDGITTKKEFYKKIRDELGKGRIEELAGIPCLVFSDPSDESRLAYYVFNPKETYFSRITTHPFVNDPFWQVFNGAGISLSSEKMEFLIDQKKYYQQVFVGTDDTLRFINICLKELYPRDDDKLADILRKKTLEMIYNAGSGHIGASFSCAEIISVLYGSVMRYDPKNPRWEDRDRFILSKGHAAPMLYAVLGLAGFFPEEEFSRLRKIGTLLQGHPKMEIPGVDSTTGRLGQGPSFGAGLALSAKKRGKDYRIYVLIGDAEFNEGQIKEAAEHIPVLGLDNLTVVLDNNRHAKDRPISQISRVDHVKFWESCGWNVISVDGHNVRELLNAFNEAKEVKGKPTIIIANTRKGKGAVSIEADPVKYHGKVPTRDIYEEAILEIEERLGDFTDEDARRLLRKGISGATIVRCPVFIPPVRSNYREGTTVATGEAFGNYILKIAEKNEQVYAGSADLTETVSLLRFSKDYPGRYIPFGIHEAHMAGVAGGLASTGIIPFIGTMDVFTEEMSSVITMIDQMRLPVVFEHTHSGLAVGEDGTSHQSRTEPLKMLDLPNIHYFEPADANETEECLDIIMELASKGQGPFYLRLTRQKVPAISMPFGMHTHDGAYCVYDSKTSGDEKSSYIFIAAGAMVSECIKAGEVLKGKGIYGKVINMPRPDYVEKNPGVLISLLEKGVPIFTVHDATPRVLGSVVNGIVAGNKDLQPITVKNIGIPGWTESGSTEELYKKYGLSSDRLVSVIRDEVVDSILKGLRNSFDNHRKENRLTIEITKRIADDCAGLFVNVYKDEGRIVMEAIDIIGEIISLDDESLARPGTSALFGRIIEVLNDTFLFENRKISMQVLTRVTWILANSPKGKIIKDTLANFGIGSEEELLDRAYKAIEEKRFNGDRNKIKKAIVLSHITKGADVAVNSIIMERLKSIFPDAEIVLLGIPKDRELFGGDPRIRIEEIDYERRGSFISRLNSRADVINRIKGEVQGLDKDEYIVIDADTRISQVWVLPCIEDIDNYFFFLSTLGVEGNTIGEVVNNWLDRVFGKSGFTYPIVSLKEEDNVFASQVRGKLKNRYLISISLGVGGVEGKKSGRGFDIELIERLLEMTENTTILLDKGTEEYNEPPYVTSLVDELRRRGKVIVDAACLTEGVIPDIVTWHGSLGGFAGLIGISDQYVGYDSCFGHVAGALGISETIIFAGYPNNLFLTRWTPLNRNELKMVEVPEDRRKDEDGIMDEVVRDCIGYLVKGKRGQVLLLHKEGETSLKDFVESRESFESEHVRMQYDRYSNSINIQVFQDIKDLYSDSLDNTLFIYIDLTEDYHIKNIRLLKFQHPLSLLTVSIFLEKVGFSKKFPLIFEALRREFNLPRDIEGLADYTGKDTAIYSDIAGLTHRTLPSDLTKDLGCSFRQIDITKVSLRDILEEMDFKDAILFESDNITMQYNTDSNMVLINIREEGEGKDKFEIYIILAEDCTVKDIYSSYSLYALSRSTVSLTFNRTDFANRFPLIFDLIRKQFVLPIPTEEISLQEMIANGLIAIDRYEEMISRGMVDEGLILELSLLRYSKSWEVRRKVLKVLRYLGDKKYISHEELRRHEGLFFKEDIKEDLKQIERLLRNNTDYVRKTFKNLFGRDITLSQIYNSEINIRYVGRGFNKQIYKVEWRTSPDEVYVFAISTIRDAQIGQGDFSASMINSMLKNWEQLSQADNPYVPSLGAYEWEEDYRPNNIELAEYPEKIVKDNIMFVSREFVEGVNLEQVLSGINITEEEKEKARLAGLRALLGIWRSSRDKDGKGIFMTTPKPDDVVVFKGPDGEWQAKVIDLDALEDGITVNRVIDIFNLCTWCPPGLVRRLVYCDDIDGQGEFILIGGDYPDVLTLKEVLFFGSEKKDADIRQFKPLAKFRDKKSRILAEENGRLFVIRMLFSEEEEEHCLSIGEVGKYVSEDYPHVYHPMLMENSGGVYAVVYPYIEGINFEKYFSRYRGQPPVSYILELIDYVIKISNAASYLQEIGLPGVWDINSGNIIITPDGSVVFTDYTRMYVDPVSSIMWLLYSIILDKLIIREGLKMIRSVYADEINSNIVEKLTRFYEYTENKKFSSIKEFLDKLGSLRDEIAFILVKSNNLPNPVTENRILHKGFLKGARDYVGRIDLYSPLAGVYALRELAARFINSEVLHRQGIRILPQDVIIGLGTTGLLELFTRIFCDIDNATIRPDEEKDLIALSPAAFSLYKDSIFARKSRFESPDPKIMPKARIIVIDSTDMEGVKKDVLNGLLSQAHQQKSVVIFLDNNKQHKGISIVYDLLRKNKIYRENVIIITDISRYFGLAHYNVGSFITFNRAIQDAFTTVAGGSYAAVSQATQAGFINLLKLYMRYYKGTVPEDAESIGSVSDISVVNRVFRGISPDPTLAVNPFGELERYGIPELFQDGDRFHIKTLIAILGQGYDVQRLNMIQGQTTVSEFQTAFDKVKSLGLLNALEESYAEYTVQLLKKKRELSPITEPCPVVVSVLKNALEEGRITPEEIIRFMVVFHIKKMHVGTPGFPRDSFGINAAMPEGIVSEEELDGFIDALDEVGAYFANDVYGLQFNKRNVASGYYGSKPVLQDALLGLSLLTGKPIALVIPRPYYVGYDSLRRSVGIPDENVIYVNTQTRNKWRPTRGEIRDSFKKYFKGKEEKNYQKVLLLTTPNNPTGVMLTKFFIKEILRYAVLKNVFLIFDVAYARLLFNGREPANLGQIIEELVKELGKSREEIARHFILVMTQSKEILQPGGRYGMGMSGNIELIEKMREIKTLRADPIASYAEIRAYGQEAERYAKRYIKRHNRHLQRNKEYICKVFDKLGIHYIEPEGAFYIMFRIGKSGYIRFSYAGSYGDIIQVMTRLQDCCGQIKGMDISAEELFKIIGVTSLDGRFFGASEEYKGSHIVKRIEAGKKEERVYSIVLEDMLRGALDRLKDIYGLGIDTMIDRIEVVENLGGDGLYPEGRAPLASFRNGILKVDRLLFDYGPYMLFEELEHEFLESIAGVIPGSNHAISDVVSTVRNVRRFLGLGSDEQEEFLSVLRGENPIDPDGEYLALLERLRGIKDVTDNEIIASVVRYVMRTKLYENIRDQLGLPEELAVKIRDIEPRLDDALAVFNEIAKAKQGVELAEQIRETEEVAITVVKTFTVLRLQGLDKISRDLAGLVSAVAKQISSVDKLSGRLAKADTIKYILVDSGRLKELKDAMGEEKYKQIERHLFENNYNIIAELPSGVDLEDVVRLVDPADVEGMPRVEKMLYLPMPYTRSALYMAAYILQAGGDLSKVPLVRQLIKDLYTELNESDLGLLITQPWQILPKIQRVLDNLDNLRKAIAQIEKAA